MIKKYLKRFIRQIYANHIGEVYIPSGTKLEINTHYKSGILVCPKTGKYTSFSFLGHNIFFK